MQFNRKALIIKPASILNFSFVVFNLYTIDSAEKFAKWLPGQSKLESFE